MATNALLACRKLKLLLSLVCSLLLLLLLLIIIVVVVVVVVVIIIIIIIIMKISLNFSTLNEAYQKAFLSRGWRLGHSDRTPDGIERSLVGNLVGYQSSVLSSGSRSQHIVSDTGKVATSSILVNQRPIHSEVVGLQHRNISALSREYNFCR